jgi:hypothetical protein
VYFSPVVTNDTAVHQLAAVLLSYVVSVNAIVEAQLWLAVNVHLEVPFCVIVNVQSFTVGIVGLFNITHIPVVAFQSLCTCAAGIVGLLDKSL